MKKTDYIVLARKYRPQGFDEVLGQPAVSVTLKNALEAKRLAHAYLFTGPRGVGKTTMARILAKALNCAKGPTPEPCGQCAPCAEIAASSCLDVLEMDAASHTGVDNVRQVIIETVGLAPSRDRYKVFIIDEAHMLSTAAFNALLKTLEEPPAHVVFVLATTEAAKVPATIASRCQRFRFRPIPVEILAEHLGRIARKEKIDAEPAALELLARSAEGSLRDAVSLLDQCHAAGDAKIGETRVREMFGFVPQDMLRGVAQALLSRQARELGVWLKRVYDEGVEPAQLLKDLRAALEEDYLSKLGAGDKSAGSGAGAAPLAQDSSPEALAFLLRRVNKTLEELRYGDSPRLILELGLFGCLGAAPDLGAWVERLEGLERRLAGGEGAAPARPPAAPPQAAAKAVAQAPRAPQSGPAGGPAGEVGAGWPAVVAALRQEKAALGAALEGARLVPSAEGSWRLVFRRNFELEQAKRSLPLIVAKLSTVAGREVRLSLEVGDTGEAGPSEAVDAGLPEASSGPAEAPPGTAWKDIAEPGTGKAPPKSLRKAQEILGGKLRIVKKPQ